MTGDPRVIGRERYQGIVPVVERPRGGLSALGIGLVAALLGVILFALLTVRRPASGPPPVAEGALDAGAGGAAPPPLYVPAPPPPPLPVEAAPPPLASRPEPVSRAYLPPALPTPAVRRRNDDEDEDHPARRPGRPSVAGRPALVIDNSRALSAGQNGEAATGTLGALVAGTERTRSGMFANPSTTVPQGAIIPAVLESAIDSGRPSQVTALVQRDVRGFDGTRVLIPRGSRLIGDLRSDALPGQNRANVIWNRLIRPDGTTIALASPAADPLGRAGVKGKVDSHFWARFGGALLQSTLDIGATIAARSGGGASVVLLPGSISNSSGAASAGGGLIRQTSAPPTITVPAGRSVSVSVVRDLDFTGAGD